MQVVFERDPDAMDLRRRGRVPAVLADEGRRSWRNLTRPDPVAAASAVAPAWAASSQDFVSEAMLECLVRRELTTER